MQQGAGIENLAEFLQLKKGVSADQFDLFIQIPLRHAPFPGSGLQSKRFGGSQDDLLDQPPDFQSFHAGRLRVFEPFQRITTVQNVQLHGQVGHHILGAEPGSLLFLHCGLYQPFHNSLFGGSQLHQGACVVNQHSIDVFRVFLQAHGHEVTYIKGDTHGFERRPCAADTVKMIHVQAEKTAFFQKEAGPVDKSLPAAPQNIVHFRLLMDLSFQRFRQFHFLYPDTLFFVVHIIVGTDVPILLLFHRLRLLPA